MANPDPDPEAPEPEPSWWKARIRAMVEDADARLADIRRTLDGVPVHLEPMSVHESACARNRITQARATLMVATEDLVFCAALMRAVEILALHAVETFALDLADVETGGLQRALVTLIAAREHAVNAHSAVHGCNGYLVTAFVLLDPPANPGVDPFLNQQRKQTVANLGIARHEAQQCATLVNLAGQDLATDH